MLVVEKMYEDCLLVLFKFSVVIGDIDIIWCV